MKSNRLPPPLHINISSLPGHCEISKPCSHYRDCTGPGVRLGRAITHTDTRYTVVALTYLNLNLNLELPMLRHH
jgi:hypothetical protein